MDRSRRRYVKTSAQHELSYHAVRVLIIVDRFSRNTGERISGLKKLARLDFILRYPIFLERLLVKKGIPWMPGAEPTTAERNSIESHMVRYKFDSFDERYYLVVGLLVGKGLVKHVAGQEEINLCVSGRGRDLARRIGHETIWARERLRCDVIYDNFNITGENLNRLIDDEMMASARALNGEYSV